MIECSLLLDRALNFKAPLSVPKGSEIKQLKEQMCKFDPTQSLRVESFDLAFIVPEPPGKPLPDEFKITENCELEVMKRPMPGGSSSSSATPKETPPVAAGEPLTVTLTR